MDKAAEQTKAEVKTQPGVSEAEELARQAEKEARKRDFDEAVRKTRPKDALDGLGSGLGTAAAGILGGVCVVPWHMSDTPVAYMARSAGIGDIACCS